MSLHDGNRDVQEVYFCTITCFRWLNLFEESGSYHSVYRWFNHLKTDECHVLGNLNVPETGDVEGAKAKDALEQTKKYMSSFDKISSPQVTEITGINKINQNGEFNTNSPQSLRHGDSAEAQEEKDIDLTKHYEL